MMHLFLKIIHVLIKMVLINLNNVYMIIYQNHFHILLILLHIQENQKNLQS